MYARRKLSCTTSSASCWLRVIRNASRNKGRLWRSTSTRNASVSPVRALVTRPRSLHSIRLFFRLHGLAAVSKLVPGRVGTGGGSGGMGLATLSEPEAVELKRLSGVDHQFGEQLSEQLSQTSEYF